MYSSIEIAEYIIWYCDTKQNYCVTYELIQDLLYLIQAYFLIEKDISCFEDAIYATDEGPMVLKVKTKYSKYKGIIKKNNFNHSINNEDVLLINDIIKNFIRKNIQTTTETIIKQEPFIRALKREDREINLEELKAYFDKYDNNFLRFNLLTYNEQKYLKSYVKPFKDQIVGILKFKVNDENAECLEISYHPFYTKYPRTSFVFLPEYTLYTTYKNLEFDREYTIKELGL